MCSYLLFRLIHPKQKFDCPGGSARVYFNFVSFQRCYFGFVNRTWTGMHVFDVTDLPGQFRALLHITVSLSSPIQFSPPKYGAGLLHIRLRILVPFPHVAVHSDHCSHPDQCPSTLQ